jgi:hypothetical protein
MAREAEAADPSLVRRGPFWPTSGSALDVLVALASVVSSAFGVFWLIRWPSLGLGPTDEAFYILAMQPQNSRAAYNGMFGWYLARIAETTGLTVPGLRVTGVIALFGAGLGLGWQTRQLLSHRTRLTPWESTTVVAGVASSTLLYYCFHFPRTPSYNWFAVVGIELVVAGVVRILRETATSRRTLPGTTGIALGLYLCAIGKLLSAVLIAGLVLVLLIGPMRTTWSGALRRVLLIAAWGPVALLVHHALILDLGSTYAALQRATAHLEIIDPDHYTPAAALLATGVAILWVLRQVLVPMYLTPVLGLLGAVPRLPTRAIPGLLIGVPVFAMHRIVVAAPLDYFDIVVASGLPVVAALFSTYANRIGHRPGSRSDLLVSLVMVLMLPAYVFGSNVGITLYYPGLTSVLLVAALIALGPRTPGFRRVCMSWCLIATLMVTPSLIRASRTDWMAQGGYGRETHLVVTTERGERIGVDAETAAWLTQTRQAADAAGWQPGTPLVDAAFCTIVPLSFQARVPNTLLPGFGGAASSPESTAAALRLDPAQDWSGAWLLLPDNDADWTALTPYTGRVYPRDYERIVRLPPSCQGPMSLWRPSASWKAWSVEPQGIRG